MPTQIHGGYAVIIILVVTYGIGADGGVRDFIDESKKLKIVEMATEDRGSDGKRGRDGKASMSDRDQTNKETSEPRSSTDTDLVAWLKGVAISPGTAEISRDTDKKLWDDVLKVRKLLLFHNPERRRSKRKLEMYLSDDKASSSSPGSSESNTKKKPRLSSSTPRSPSTTASGESHRQKTVKKSSLSRKEDSAVEDTPRRDSRGSVRSSDLSNSQVKSTGATDLFTKNEKTPVIPVGCGFQPEVPDWDGPPNSYGDRDDSETLKWLGTKIWPIKGRKSKTDKKAIGAGRPESCSCVSPGSKDCVKQHIHMARQHLQSELGPAFFSMKFDEIGAVVSESWTAKEEQRFETLLKRNPLSGDVDVWHLASKSFPSKSRRNMMDYYYNVYLPKRVRELSESSPAGQLESDDDHADRYTNG